MVFAELFLGRSIYRALGPERLLFDWGSLRLNPSLQAMEIRGTGQAFPRCSHISLVEMPLDWKGLENPFREDALGWGVLKCLSELFCSRNVPSSALFCLLRVPSRQTYRVLLDLQDRVL